MHKIIIAWTDKKINGVNANSLTMLYGVGYGQGKH